MRGEAEPNALYSLLWELGLSQHHEAVLRIREGYAAGVLSVEGVFEAVRPACLLEVDAVKVTRAIVDTG
ncbi:hypothetical protein [Deinococcus aluminii]|uniref:Uncharacterized protein n=1 Tax=Deinococcus aluminii TaxID=1656885 RepID=A0ABP9XDH7_9DEIO